MKERREKLINVLGETIEQALADGLRRSGESEVDYYREVAHAQMEMNWIGRKEYQALTAELQKHKEAVKYALGCIDGTIRDYKDELPNKLRSLIHPDTEGK